MAFVSASTFLPKPSSLQQTCAQKPSTKPASVTMADPTPASGKAKKARRYRPTKNIPANKQKLEPETTFLETAPSRYELIVPTISVLTVIGIIPFIAAVARAAWVRYKFTSRRISISSGFQGKDQTEIIYRDIESIKFVRRLGGAADCVISLKDGAKLEIRAVPDFDKVFEYMMEKVDDSAKQASGSA